MKKLLILGSDYGTYDLVECAKQMGIYTIVADLMETSPTKEIADETWLISTTELSLLEKKIKENAIDGILAGASEFNLEKCRILAKRIGLPIYCNDNRAWEISRNKYKFKKLCKKNGVSVATDYELTNIDDIEELKKVKFPVVVKPVDASGNRGISYCNDIDELKVAYKLAKEASNNEKIIIERELKGPKYTTYYILANGKAKMHFQTSDHNQIGELPNIYSIKALVNENIPHFLEEINENIINVLIEAGCKEGVAWVETMLDEDGHFYAIEMGYRFGGPVIYVMVDKLSKFNTMQWMINYSLGRKNDIDLLEYDIPMYDGYAVSYNLFTNKSAKIKKIVGLDEIVKISGVKIDMPKRENSYVRDHANMGVIRIIGANCKDVCKKINEINNTLKIIDEENENIYIKFTDFSRLEEEFINGSKELLRSRKVI